MLLECGYSSFWSRFYCCICAAFFLHGLSLFNLWWCSLYQGCVAGTQISGSSCRHLKFLPPTPSSEHFLLQLWNDLIYQKLKIIVLFVQIACPTNYVCWTGTRISGSSFTIWNFLTLAPATQNCLGSGCGSTALVCILIEISIDGSTKKALNTFLGKSIKKQIEKLIILWCKENL